MEDIAAGLSISVVKNALYKVIRCTNAEALGKHIVVQGGTFLNDSVLRAFERETGREVIRPGYAALMGAYGAALYALAHDDAPHKAVLSAEDLAVFTHSVKATTCSGCGNHCNLTINTFGGNRRFIAGNRCDKPVTGKRETFTLYDLYDYQIELLLKWQTNDREAGKPTIGIPLGLNLYELLPFWHSFWKTLGFNVIVSPLSTRDLYLRGQYTIPSDTACYPAKLMHGHIEALLDEAPDAIFYPDGSYNTEEGLGTNHYNCPVVAYYPQVLALNVPRLSETTFINDFVSLSDRRQFAHRMTDVVQKYFPAISGKQVKAAAKAAYAAYEDYFRRLRAKGQEFLAIAKAEKRPVIILSGRPYHVDPEINHGIHDLICRLGAIVITEDSVSHLVQAFPVGVMNQWTYHARLYAAARFAASAPPEANINLVQLVSFGCGLDAITTDEVRSILESSGKIYTQIKIDEISNMGAVNIRLRSLFSAIEDKGRRHPA